MDAAAVRAAVCATARAMHREGLVRLSEGNVSARCPDGRIAITPGGLAYAAMQPEDVVVVDAAGRVVAGERTPSSELPMHLGLLAALPRYGAVVHTHSPYAVAFACCARPVPAVTAESLVIGGAVPVARFAEPGTADMATAVLSVLGEGRAALLQSHGAVTLGEDLERALTAAVYVEQAAQAAVLAAAVGTPIVLGER